MRLVELEAASAFWTDHGPGEMLVCEGSGSSGKKKAAQ